MGSGLPQRWSNIGTQRGLLTPTPQGRDHRWLGARDLGIETGGTYGPGLTRASWVPEDRRFLGSHGVNASTPMPGGKDWIHERRVGRHSPIADGQPSRSLPRMVPGDLGGVDARPNMPERGVKDGSTSPQEAGVTGTAISLGRPSPGLGGMPDGTGSVYLGTAELWTAASFVQCTPGHANPGYSGPLSGVGRSL